MGGSKKSEPPQVQYTTPPQTPEQTSLLQEVEIPYYKSKYQQYLNLYEPLERQIGGKIGSELTSPRMPETLNLPRFTLPEDEYNQIWQQGRERVVGQYEPIRQQASERAAGRGMLGQGPTEKYFQQLDLSQAKSMEDMAVDMAIQQWSDKKQVAEMNFQQSSQEAFTNWQMKESAKEASLQNALNFLSGQPIFTPNFPTSQAYIPPQASERRSLGQSVGRGALGGAAVGAGIGMMGGPIGALGGAAIGGLAGLASGI